VHHALPGQAQVGGPRRRGARDVGGPGLGQQRLQRRALQQGQALRGVGIQRLRQQGVGAAGGLRALVVVALQRQCILLPAQLLARGGQRVVGLHRGAAGDQHGQQRHQRQAEPPAEPDVAAGGARARLRRALRRGRWGPVSAHRVTPLAGRDAAAAAGAAGPLPRTWPA
jgi:hypothetical protein